MGRAEPVGPPLLIRRVASEPQPRGFVKHMLSPKRQPKLIINLVAVVDSGSGVELFFPTWTGRSVVFLGASVRRSTPPEPVGYCIARALPGALSYHQSV